MDSELINVLDGEDDTLEINVIDCDDNITSEEKWIFIYNSNKYFTHIVRNQFMYIRIPESDNLCGDSRGLYFMRYINNKSIERIRLFSDGERLVGEIRLSRYDNYHVWDLKYYISN